MTQAPSRPVPKRTLPPAPTKPPADEGHFVRHAATGYHAGASVAPVVNQKNVSSPGRAP